MTKDESVVTGKLSEGKTRITIAIDAQISVWNKYVEMLEKAFPNCTVVKDIKREVKK